MSVAVEVAATPLERRRGRRYQLLQRCFVRPEGTPGKGGWRCIAYSVSSTGIGVTLPCPLPLKARVRVTPWQLPRAPALEARVARIRAVGFVWFAGCELVGTLTDADLAAWLAGPLDLD